MLIHKTPLIAQLLQLKLFQEIGSRYWTDYAEHFGSAGKLSLKAHEAPR